MKKESKKKHSLDLSATVFKQEKNITPGCERILKKSNPNSLSSNAVMSMVSTQHKKLTLKQPKPIHTQKQKQLNKLLENFRYGSIDKSIITKEIFRIFDNKIDSQESRKKSSRTHRKNGTVSANPSTPRNSQLLRLNSFAVNNIKNIHKVRKRQCNSARSTFSKSKSIVVPKKNFMEKIVEIKGIDSSLFISQKEDQYVNFEEAIVGIKTSDSVIHLNEHLKQQRKSFSIKLGTNPYRQRMAIRIQRAWRKYKTKKLIEMVFNTHLQPEKVNKVPNNIDQSPIVTEHDTSERYQSQEIGGKGSMKESQKTKGEILRVQELEKWNQIMDYVKMNMENKQISSDQCLNRIIDYFENVKNTVEKQVCIGQVKKQNGIKKLNEELPKPQQKVQLRSEEEIIMYSPSQESSIIEIQEASQDFQLLGEEKKIQLAFNIKKLRQKFINQKNISFKSIQQALDSYNKEIQCQKEQEIEELDLYSRDYLKKKDKIEKKYNQTKRELRKIIKNLNRGYQQVKTILNKSLKDEQPRVSKCKSDDYLLKAAISYKEYVETIQNNEKIEKNIINHQEKPKNQGIGIKLDETIMSEQLLQYQQLQRKFDVESDDDQRQAEEISLFDNHMNQKSKKLQYVTVEDKQDIFQFIFIDLTLELTTEIQPKNKVIQTIKNHLEKTQRLKSMPRGVKTNLIACKEYLSKLHEYLKRNYLDVYEKHIQVPMGPSAIEMLKYMHENDEESSSEDENEIVPLILPIYIFQNHEEIRQYKYEKYYDQQEKENSRCRFLKSVQHIHCKAIFDCLNEWLDAERPFGIWGKPFPWKRSVKTDHISKHKKYLKLGVALDRTVECCSYLCGILVDKEDSVFSNHKISDHYVDQIREDRMSKMLSNELQQSEQKWVFYDDEETQVLIELTKHVMRRVFDEACLDLMNL